MAEVYAALGFGEVRDVSVRSLSARSLRGDPFAHFNPSVPGKGGCKSTWDGFRGVFLPSPPFPRVSRKGQVHFLRETKAYFFLLVVLHTGAAVLRTVAGAAHFAYTGIGQGAPVEGALSHASRTL